MSTADALFHLLAPVCSDGLVQVSADGVVVYANPRAAALLDISVERLQGARLADFGLSAQAGVLHAGELEVHVQALDANDGQLLVLQPAASGGPEAARGQLVESIQHVLRNQIAAITGYLDLIDRPALSADDAEFVGRAQATADRLNAALPVLIDIAWIDSAMPLARGPVDLSAMAAQMLDRLQTAAAGQSLALHAALASDLPPVLGNAERLGQVITELVRNALVYSHPGGAVSVKTWAEGGQACLSVADCGIGISAHDADMVFDRLFRSTDPRVRAIPGHGLGLTLARRITRVHGGTLTVQSTLDQGSTFTLRLPAIP